MVNLKPGEYMEHDEDVSGGGGGWKGAGARAWRGLVGCCNWGGAECTALLTRGTPSPWTSCSALGLPLAQRPPSPQTFLPRPGSTRDPDPGRRRDRGV